ncbi:MAG: HD domain-containing protein [Candidatus Zapsychrus exili]|nr:HD domain-containing protein [Candidatus Zapsychrus exili]
MIRASSEFKHIKMNPFSLSFSKDIEGDFLSHYCTKYLNHIRWSMFLGIAIWGLFGVLDVWIAPRETLFKLFLMRYAIVWPIMVISIILSYTKNVKKYIGFAISIGILASGLGVIAKAAIVPAEMSYIWNASIIVIFIYSYAIMRSRFVWAATIGVIIIIAYELVAINIIELSKADLLNNNFFIITGNLIGMYVCYFMEMFARKDFLYSRLIISERNKIARINTQLKSEISERLEVEKSLEEHQSDLEKLISERTKDLERTQEEIIYTLAHASEYRDNETGKHIQRMSQYCALLGHAIGLDKKECELLDLASQMHDIGKIGIPDSVLLKPGKLDKEEWEIMKTHAKIGAQILPDNNSKLLSMAKVIALTHHENWDGTGYPQKLKEENIPLLGRIVRLCDVFDALTSRRPYKEAWPIEQALAEIYSLDGIQFDPNLVAKFKEVLPYILEISNKPNLTEK